jgi:nitrate/TMAO reductase-like tetraheme cytochrome c subunit
MYGHSIHGEFACVACHSDITEIPHAEKLQKVDCGVCHEDASKAYQKSIHAQSRQKGLPDAPACIDCHGKHDILPVWNPESKTHPLKLAATCATCHSDPKIVKKYDIPVKEVLAAYQKSVHGVALLSEQNFDAATCNSCHNSHDIRPLDDPQSTIFWKNVPETCGKCHGEIYEQYTESVHWAAAKKGIRTAPVCTDCHGEHEVKSPQDPTSPVHPLRVATATCERCHASELITERYGIAKERVATFEDSYHGLAIKGGSLAAANCASCHGIHNILPSSDPRSMIHPANLHKTCGSCHAGATVNFAKGPVHLTTTTTPGRVVEYVQKFYISLIIVIVGAMIIHNGADFIRRAQRHIHRREEE